MAGPLQSKEYSGPNNGPIDAEIVIHTAPADFDKFKDKLKSFIDWVLNT